MTSRTKKILIAILVIVGIILAILLAMRVRTSVTQPKPTVTEQPTTSVIPVTSQEAVTQRVEASSVQTTAKIFAERYGSYSSESNFANIVDVLPLTTAEYRARLQAYVATAETPTELYTVTTRVVAMDVEAEETRATVKLSTQRTESKGSLQNISIRYQDITLTLEKQGDTWLVSSATWES